MTCWTAVHCRVYVYLKLLFNKYIGWLIEFWHAGNALTVLVPCQELHQVCVTPAVAIMKVRKTKYYMLRCQQKCSSSSSSSSSSSEEGMLLQCRWCWRVFGCLAVADWEADKSQEHTRLSVCVRSQVYGSVCVQSTPLPCTNTEGLNCECHVSDFVDVYEISCVPTYCAVSLLLNRQ